MLDYLLGNLVHYWNLFEINNWSDIFAVGAMPSAIFLIAAILIAKIIHMHVNRNRRVVSTVFKKMREEIRLYNEFLAYQAEHEQLQETDKERRDNISNAYTGDNLLRSKIARYKTANDELKQRNGE
jgi:hypothetical protein